MVQDRYCSNSFLGGSDYQALSASLNFTSSGNQCVNIDIFDDNRVERTEKFHVNLVQLSDKVRFINSSVSVIIEDNDGIVKSAAYKNYYIVCCMIIMSLSCQVR